MLRFTSLSMCDSAMDINMSKTDKLPEDISDRDILKLIWNKVANLDDLTAQVKHIDKRLQTVESGAKNMSEQFVDMDLGLSHMEEDIMTIKSELAQKALVDEVYNLKKKIVDQSNRSRRNNIIIHNLPEGYEKAENPKQSELKLRKLVDQIAKFSGITHDLEIERLHRGPPVKPRPTTTGETPKTPPPRKLYVRYLRTPDKDEMTKYAVKHIKNFKLNEETDPTHQRKMWITDDVDPVTVKIHGLLLEKMLAMREEGKFAFIPFSVPRIIKYRDSNVNTPLKVYKLPEEAERKCYEQFNVQPEGAEGMHM